MQSRSLLFIALSSGALLAASSVLAAGPGLQVNRAVEFKPVGHAQTMVEAPQATTPPSGEFPVLANEWFDTWLADANDGPSWYSPEDYEFVWGDTLALVTYIFLEGPTQPLTRLDLFYLCGERDPMEYVATGGWVDFGDVPETPPYYGWILGIKYPAPPIRHRVFDSASRIHWGRDMDYGVPLAGRPDCFEIN